MISPCYSVEPLLCPCHAVSFFRCPRASSGNFERERFSEEPRRFLCCRKPPRICELCHQSVNANEYPIDLCQCQGSGDDLRAMVEQRREECIDRNRKVIEKNFADHHRTCHGRKSGAFAVKKFLKWIWVVMWPIVSVHQ